MQAKKLDIVNIIVLNWYKIATASPVSSLNNTITPRRGRQQMYFFQNLKDYARGSEFMDDVWLFMLLTIVEGSIYAYIRKCHIHML